MTRLETPCYSCVLGLPPELYEIHEAYPWRWGEFYCRFKIFLTETTSTASILTIAALTIERYCAITHPLQAREHSTTGRAVKCIVAIWLVAGMSAVVYPLTVSTFYAAHDERSGAPLDDSLICNITPELRQLMRYGFQISTFSLFFLPMALIICLYIAIGVTLRRAAKRRCMSREGQSGQHGGVNNPAKVIPMLGELRSRSVQCSVSLTDTHCTHQCAPQ